ncbi:MAG: NAD(P)H-dependent oxidoreductase [Pseudomonadales bacterium]|jgi:putative NADPH-quinone reductase|nr:NAD(P)H-dependent oxidoreductase [Pseudomonadales bacterium]
MTKRIFILDGHPGARSLSRSLAEAYGEAAREAGHEVRMTHLHDLSFDGDRGRAGYAHAKPLEPVLEEEVLQHLEWCEHLVLATPLWWGGLPAKLKGLIDRSFLPGRVFDTDVPEGRMPKPLLTGRSARVLITSDTPGWFMRLAYRNAVLWQLRGQILGFVGFKPTRFSQFAGASDPAPGTVEGWLRTARKLGTRAI